MDAALVILDGWGLGDHDGRDAVEAADTPVFDRLSQVGAAGRLEVAGRRVGLPEGQMGNSEVGHLNIGAGRVVYQEYTRISDAIADGSFHENDAIDAAFDHAEDEGGQVHFLGLVSDGGVHSDHEHLHALIRMAADRGLEAVTHAFMDGRDTSPTGGAGYLADLEDVIETVGTGHVATVTGRYYAMDRDQNWERTKRAYDAIVHREGDWTAESAVEAVENSYDRDVTDEFVEPTLITDRPALEDGDSAEQRSAGSHLALRDGDAAIWFNFRSDRARQLTRMLADIRPEWAFETDPPDVEVVTMTQYDKTFDLPVAFPPTQPTNTLGEVLANAGKSQLRIAESEKYAHVTYFLNGGREVEFDGEIREIVESPDVPTYDEQPEMSAPAVTDTAIEIVEGETRPEGASRQSERGETTREHDDPDVLVLNYANPDMVGHTGDYEAAIAAVEAVDEQLGRLLETLEDAGAHVVVTADHGNADDMGTEDDPHTAHTYNDVPFVYVAPDGTDGGERAGDGSRSSSEQYSDGGRTVREGGTLADIAPTLLSLIDVDQPPEMTGEHLLE
ncbi:2,3-bisphosphoglycerate-independent phosphoglycerate mutase [Natrialbaceae archaeon AArc-T1-2]|uniref:2,3-bisphosphoglycerate-independent phosphoglycerate mutase n=1 Tax=Natrialbaceae archaeon AArc-T1-2 TaxID=3053904 RepID=UPI00255B15DB|nr:2,3-bisphosphoglycerate-independent phosphoglycerate mutase [Natrialbaceae archaeon AArc-T1-2]WIV66091.1 2,3-bisphosphoglycerate-independent phosphoglycerate mutase [Natrialbaceae archaeon AArc-T1-2]